MELSALSLSSDVMDALLFPAPAEVVWILQSEPVGSYLRKCRTNLLSEVWGLYKSKIHPFGRNWRDALMPRLYNVH